MAMVSMHLGTFGERGVVARSKKVQFFQIYVYSVNPKTLVE